MTDFYQTLGVSQNASQEDIKKAYRKLAGKHHPDRGGDTKIFQTIEEAYRTLSDPQTRAQYDNPQPQFHFNSNNMDDMFGAMFGGGFGGFRQRAMTRNKSINIRVEMTLEEILKGKEVVGSIRLPSGRDQAIHLTMPSGIMNGDTIRFRGIGDDTIQGIPRGDLIAQIVELPHPVFRRDGNNLYAEHSISAFEAILGKTIRITTVDGTQLEINVPPGIQPDQMIKCDDYGLPSTNNSKRGKLFIQIKVTVPRNLFTEDKLIVEELIKRYGS